MHCTHLCTRSFFVRSQHVHRAFLSRHGRVPLGRIPQTRQLDLTIRRGRKDDVVSVRRRVCIPPRGRVEVEKEKRKQVQQERKALKVRGKGRGSEHTVRRAWEGDDGPVHPEHVRDVVHPNIVDSVQFFVCGRHEQQPARDLDVQKTKTSWGNGAYPDATSN